MHLLIGIGRGSGGRVSGGDRHASSIVMDLNDAAVSSSWNDVWRSADGEIDIGRVLEEDVGVDDVLVVDDDCLLRAQT